MKKGTCVLIDVVISGDKNLIKKEARKYFKICRTYNRNTVHVECKKKSDISNNRGNWNHLKIVQKMPEQHTVKVRHQGTT